ncbi:MULTISPECIES: hypothetical protein [unclassified Streptomyces]|uniref:hypothetical protein n=1 Tax=unclassified Streptomyces TaxID=2593676 RepID=UPI002E15C454|nr:hypothetical protein OG452_24680 [Streptomyces sp. NBC_01197]WSS49052.1 hypothetical protein OG708_10565 [Streptomyces sp. NBC_01180]
MGRRLATAVHVLHPVTHEWLVLEPGDEPDGELAAEITNPYAWEDGEEPAEGDEAREESGLTAFGFTAPREPEPEPTGPKRRRRAADSGTTA